MENTSLIPARTTSMLKEEIRKNKEEIRRKEEIVETIMAEIQKMLAAADPQKCREAFNTYLKEETWPFRRPPYIEGFLLSIDTWTYADIKSYTDTIMSISDELTRLKRLYHDDTTVRHCYFREMSYRSPYYGVNISPNMEDIIEMFRQPLAAFAYKLTGDTEAIDDLMQQMWMQLFRSKLLRYTELPLNVLHTWLKVVMHNIAINYLLRRHRLINVDPAEALILLEAQSQKEPSPETLLIRAEAAEELSSLLRMLPQEQCRTVYLHYIRGRKLVDVAKELGIPASTVRTQLRRGLIKIGEELQKRGVHQNDITPLFEALQTLA